MKISNLLKKWWFWIIVLLIIGIIFETIFLFIFFSTNKNKVTVTESKSDEELCQFSRQITSAIGSGNVYFSADGSMIFIEIRDYKNEYNDTKLKALFKILQDDYCKENFLLATITTYMESNGENNHLVLRNIYDIKHQKQLTESEKYINFNEYTNTVNSFGNAIYGY